MCMRARRSAVRLEPLAPPAGGFSGASEPGVGPGCLLWRACYFARIAFCFLPALMCNFASIAYR